MERTVPLTRVRNVGIMAHIDAGKTTVSERILFYAGRTYKLGEVHEGSAVMDWMDLERERGITITSAATTFPWRDHQVTLIDTPGHVDFTAEVERSLRVLDGVIAVFCAVGGVEPQSEQVWHQSEKYSVPKLAFINKMDRVGADFPRVLREIRDLLGANPVPVVIPVGSEDAFSGVIDLIDRQMIVFDEASQGAQYHLGSIPEAWVQEAQRWRDRLVEACAECDETVLSLYLEGLEPSGAQLRAAIRGGTLARRMVPVYAGSAFRNKGIQPLLDGVVDYLPSPADLPPVIHAHDEAVARLHSDEEPFSALVFKIVKDRHMGKLAYLRIYSGTLGSGTFVWNSTRERAQRVGRLLRMHANRQEPLERAFCGDIVVAVGLDEVWTGDTLCSREHPIVLESIAFPSPVMSVSLRPQGRADADRMSAALRYLSEEDPTFWVTFDRDTGETVISGMGELHLEVLVERMKREFGVLADVGRPEVAYKETGSLTAEGEYRHIKQTGGRGQYAHVCLRLEPQGPGKGFSFVSEITGGRIPASFIPAVERGVIKAMESGPFAGYPVVDMKVTLFDGSFHEVDSSDLAFMEAGRAGFRTVFLHTHPILLEPVMEVEVNVPEEALGAVASSLCQRRGRIEAMSPRGDQKVLRALVPLAEMFGYAGLVRTLTQGRGSFTMQFERYEAVPISLAEEIVRKRRAMNQVR